MRFASLGSGSDGNGLVVEAAPNGGRERPWRLLVDCGFGPREATRRLARIGLEPTDLDAVLVTHEHGDHIGGVFALARRYDLVVWASHGTLRGVMTERFERVRIQVCSAGASFAVGSIAVRPYAVPHDAREPTQFVFDDGGHRLGLLTDTGRATAHIRESLAACDALVMECNHDRAMLETSSYPWPLKRRIGGGYGHLSNDEAGELVYSLDRSRLRHLVAAHLSRQNNTPALACAAMAGATGWSAARIRAADQSDGFGWIDVASEPVFPSALF